MTAAGRIPEYRDFVVRIDRDGGAYRSHVVSSPGGEGSAPFVPPVAPESLVTLQTSLDDAMRDIAAASPDGYLHAAGRASLELAQRMGMDLYAALFRGQVRDLFEVSRPLEPGAGLRLKLRFDLAQPYTAWLAELPWELLRQPGHATYLGLDPRTPIVRFLDLQGARPLERFAPPLRVLAVSANPAGSRRLDLDAECQRIAEVARVGGAVEVIPLRAATLNRVAEYLRAHEVHILHFMGHGSFDAATRRATLLFEDEAAGQQPVSGLALANVLQGCFGLRLAVLNTCHGGEHRPAGGDDPFAGVATTLVRNGLPAAIAMRCKVSDQGAVAFTKSFYAALAVGDPVDFAVAAARLAMAPDCTRSLEWSVPMLFMRHWDGRFIAGDGQAGDGTSEPADQGKREAPGGAKHIAIKTIKGSIVNFN